MNEKLTQEMIKYFHTRTKKHIELVDKYYNKFYDKLGEKPAKNILGTHDASKFKEPEYYPYIFLTWNYHSKDLGVPFVLSAEMKQLTNEATEHHVRNNMHHPEYWSNRKDALIPRSDRDKFNPSEIPTIMVPNMPAQAIIEMCADWCAMSEEKGNTPFEWADKTVGKRWEFGPEKDKLIYSILNEMWE